jgi:hypothetical protein
MLKEFEITSTHRIVTDYFIGEQRVGDSTDYSLVQILNHLGIDGVNELEQIKG